MASALAGPGPARGRGARALGNTIGQTVVAIPLVIITRRICGKAAVQGVGHAALAALAAGAAGTAVGVTLSMAIPEQHKLEAFVPAIPAACGAIIAFGVVAYLLDDGDLRAVLASVRQDPPLSRDPASEAVAADPALPDP